MWSDISIAWQTAFRAGWESFKNGSIPIGAAICDENGEIICIGRNRINEVTGGNRRIAHAETDCLLQLDTQKYPNVKSYTLYACMEPCPMCMGTIVMSNFRKLRVAAKDEYCGAVHYCEDDSYIKSKDINVTFEGGDLQLVQLTMQSYFELKNRNNQVIECFAATCPRAFAASKKLFADKLLDTYANNNVDFEEVFDFIVSYAELND